MTLVPVQDYPIVRSLLGDTTGVISDLAIEEAVLIAEDWIVGRIPDALTETDPILIVKYERAARYLTASILAPAMIGSKADVSQFKTGDSTVSIHGRKYEEMGRYYASLGWAILEPYIIEEVTSASTFILSKTAPTYRVSS
jgi:hypothetical protein